ncbi:MAG: response regulator transcription factor [Ruminiclostridium sp.]|nr:response regulator transcription factor [Ruminiclostridium sp.]
MKRILVCEDEDAIRDFVVISLKRSGYDVIDVCNAAQAMDAYVHYGGMIDVALLDIMMPGMDGTELCRWLRQKSDTMGIIMLSAKSQEVDKVRCLTEGADDYVTKPFSPSELVARVDAVYRRVHLSSARSEEQRMTLISGPFTINTKSRLFTKNGVQIEITQVEYQLLEYFMENSGSALDRKSILTHIWGEDYFGDDKIVDVNIRRLRMKIEENPSEPRYISTIRGFGYKWCVDELVASGELKMARD